MKFSIVTPSYNKAQFLSETIMSVISQQGDFSIEYIVVDNCSVDGSMEILAEFEKRIADSDFRPGCNGVEFRYFSEPDTGMYDAVNKGFRLATGDIYAYLNADDVYLQGAFQAIACTFSRYTEIDWLKGITSYIDESGNLLQEGACYLYHQPWILQGVYGREAYFIQQDSVFWRGSLWRLAGGIDTRYTRAGDYYLWCRFAEHRLLYSLKLPVSAFRRCHGQLSEEWVAYLRECEKISPARPSLGRRLARAFFAHYDKLPPGLGPLFYRLLFLHHRFKLVELPDGVTPQLKSVAYHVV